MKERNKKEEFEQKMEQLLQSDIDCTREEIYCMVDKLDTDLLIPKDIFYKTLEDDMKKDNSKDEYNLDSLLALIRTIGDNLIPMILKNINNEKEFDVLLSQFKGRWKYNYNEDYDIYEDVYNCEITGNELLNFLTQASTILSKQQKTNQRTKPTIKNNQNKKEKKSMMNNMMKKMMDNFMPTKVAEGEVALTMSGTIAVKRKDGDFVIYNTDTKTIENQMDLVIDNKGISKMCFYMPTQKLEVGDVFKENDTYYCVTSSKDNTVKTVYLSTGRGSNTVKETNVILGSKFYKKVTSLFSMQNDSNTNPMMMAMMMGFGEDSDDNIEDDDKMSGMFEMMAMSQMLGNNNGDNKQPMNFMGGMNPMMLMMMGGSGKSSNMMEMMMMSQMFGGGSSQVNPFQNMFNMNNVNTKTADLCDEDEE